MTRSLFAAALLSMTIVAASCSTAVPRFPEPPRRAGLVNDDANVLPTDVEGRLNGMVTAFRRDSNIEFWVLTVATTSWLPTSQYAYNTISTWGLDSADHLPDVLFLLMAVNDGEWFVAVSPSLQGDVPHDIGRELGDRTLGRQGPAGIEEFVALMIDRLEKQRSGR